ncbi:hypothetical protein, partial [Bradyrhizobium sp.]|uniref:hypothetical protein n=1 Tax=Bradyrhizobium sp. TaxID=376 RepID=UPI002907181B
QSAMAVDQQEKISVGIAARGFLGHAQTSCSKWLVSDRGACEIPSSALKNCLRRSGASNKYYMRTHALGQCIGSVNAVESGVSLNEEPRIAKPLARSAPII